jgi:hypothetical protein
MSTKRESDKTTSRVFADDTAITAPAASTSPTSSLSEQRHSIDRALDETRDNIRRTIEETRREIPRNTQVISKPAFFIPVIKPIKKPPPTLPAMVPRHIPPWKLFE